MVDSSFDDSGYQVAIVAVFAAVFALFLFFKDPPIPDPSNSSAFGCYSAEGAPPILLNGNGLTVLQQGLPTVGFHLERNKTGIALSTDRRIEPVPSGDGFMFQFGPFGEFIPFYKIERGVVYGVFDEDDLNAFRMQVSADRYLAYAKSDLADCSTGN